MSACSEKLVAIGVPPVVAEKLCGLPVGTSVCLRTANGAVCYMRKNPTYVEKPA
jgi:hypothetical protein